MGDYQEQKALILDYFADMEAATVDSVESVLRKYTSDDYQFFGVHPFNEIHGQPKLPRPFGRPYTGLGRRSSGARTCSWRGPAKLAVINGS